MNNGPTPPYTVYPNPPGPMTFGSPPSPYPLLDPQALAAAIDALPDEAIDRLATRVEQRIARRQALTRPQ